MNVQALNIISDAIMPTQVHLPTEDYLILSANGDVKAVPGGAAFWALPEAQIDAYGRDWLVAEFEFDTDWPNWEMHPDADELVYVLTGEATILLEQTSGVERIHVQAPGLVRVPRGIWHTAKIHSAARFLHMTMGAGTQLRAV
jgi:mannose-6-phosphate isomerase-like protein (cupin superfamily)